MSVRAQFDPYVRFVVDTPVVRATCRRLGVTPLPAGLPLLVTAKTAHIVEPVLAYMAYRFVVRQIGGCPPRLRWAANTREATIRDLKDFCDFLDAEQLEIEDLTVEALNTYAGTMLGGNSPATGKPYAFATGVRRTSNVRAFAAWLEEEGRLRRRLDVSSNTTCVTQNGNRRERLYPATSFRGFGRAQDIIEVMTPSEAEALMHALGPLPSIRVEGRTTERSRDRLAATIALNTGLRREEVTTLPLREVQQIIRLAGQRTRFQMVPIRIFGKGGKWRKVNVPAWLISEVAVYIEDERAEAIATGKELYGRSYRPPSTLFVGHAGAATSRGCAISSGAIYDPFAAPQQALIDAGSLSRRFRFHDLRHTYAVWTWIARKRSGDVQPSKYVQAQLGHASRETTEGIYLATVSLLESQMFDVYANFLQEAADA